MIYAARSAAPTESLEKKIKLPLHPEAERADYAAIATCVCSSSDLGL
jgi:hypothetical protein